MNVQDRVMWLCDNSTDCSKLQKWVRGYVPEHYKRLNISMQEAYRLAKIGASASLTHFNTMPFFTQSLLLGASIDGKYNKIVVVTPSQYGKSWICGQIAILLASKGQRVRLGGAEESTTEIIMQNVLNHIQDAHQEIKNKILDYGDKIEKLQTSVSKKRLTMMGGGLIETMSLGATVSDPKKYNKAIGRGGTWLIDECANVPDDALVEVGRREFSRVDGKKDLLFMISNPHQMGYFYSQLTQEEPEEDTLIVWMDVRTSLEEGRIQSKDRVIKSDFFKNNSTCQRYFLCELENYSEYSMFPTIKRYDFPEDVWQDFHDKRMTFFLGVDSAYTGKDNIAVCLCGVDKYGKVYVVDIQPIADGKWVEGETVKFIIKEILKIIERFRVKYVCVDLGQGIYLVEGLRDYQEIYDFTLQGVHFGGGTTKARAKANHYSSKYGSNMRSELHLDLQSLMDNDNIFFTTRTANILEPQMNQIRTFMRGDKTAIIAKREVKKKLGHSPDELDATLLSIHALVMYNIGSGTFLYQENDYDRSYGIDGKQENT